MNDITETAVQETSEKKPGKKKIILTAVIAVLTLAVLSTSVTAVLNAVAMAFNTEKARSFQSVNTKPDFENVSDGVWNIHTEDGIRIVQLTDINLGGGCLSKGEDSMAIDAVASMLTAERPDLVIVTGNIIYSGPSKTGTLNNRSGAKLFAGLMEQLGIYWTFCWGNRDTYGVTYFDKEDIAGFYTSGDYPHCLYRAGPEDIDGYGNQVFRIVNRDGIITRALILMDTHGYTGRLRKRCDSVHENQIQWYRDTAEAMRAENVSTVTILGNAKTLAYIDEIRVVPTTVFMHTPLAEYKEAWEEYSKNGYKDTDNVKLKYGTAGEKISCPPGKDDFFEAMLYSGSTDTVFCGNGPLNRFSLEYKGISLTYGMSVDYLAGKDTDTLGSQRGCTVITVTDSGVIDWRAENYYQDKYETPSPKEEVTMQEEKGE